MQLMGLNRALENSKVTIQVNTQKFKNGKFYVICILPQFFKKLTKKIKKVSGLDLTSGL